jgi:hypothetical protein
MRRAAAAGFLYFAIVFAAGFVLGAFRVSLIAPLTGELFATLIEMPIILGASWIACLFVLRRLEVAERISARLMMGAAAFALLIGAELALGLGLMHRTLETQIAAMKTAPALIGLGGQALFAFFPLIALAMRRGA